MKIQMILIKFLTLESILTIIPRNNIYKNIKIVFFGKINPFVKRPTFVPSTILYHMWILKTLFLKTFKNIFSC